MLIALALPGAQAHRQPVGEIGRQPDLGHHRLHLARDLAPAGLRAPSAARRWSGRRSGSAGCSCRGPAAAAGSRGAWSAAAARPIAPMSWPSNGSCRGPGCSIQDSSRDRVGLAAAGFADQPEIVALQHVEADAAHRLHRLRAEEPAAVGDGIGLGDVLDRQDRLRRRGLRQMAAAPRSRSAAVACQQIAAIGVLGVRGSARPACCARRCGHGCSTSTSSAISRTDRHRGGDEQDAGVEVLAQLLAAAA